MNISFCRWSLNCTSYIVHPSYILLTSYICPSLLLFDAGILLDRFGGDGSGGFGGVSGLDAGRRGGDGSPSLAGRDTDGEGDQEERHDD